jgi:hypothetical protein
VRRGIRRSQFVHVLDSMVGHVARGVTLGSTYLPVRVGQVGAHQVGVGLPHVHGDGLDTTELLEAETLEIAVQAGLTALIRDVLHRRGIEVAHHGDVVLAPAG